MNASDQPLCVITGIGCLVTNAPIATAINPPSAIGRQHLGVVHNAWMVLRGNVIDAVGTGPLSSALEQLPRHDVAGALVIPGLIDAHTHPIFGGSRAHEFCARLDGETYQQIAAKGGGILSTVEATRRASDKELTTLLLTRLTRFMRHGVTTVEAKSGYGLTVADELRLLRLLTNARQATPQTLAITCLALHATDPSFTTQAGGVTKKASQLWVDAATQELLPEVARLGLADAVDAFVEKGYFEPSMVRPYLAKAKELGLAIRLHADEFAESGAATLAAEFGALSADHLQFAADSGVAAMTRAGVIPVLLPGTSLYTKIPYADARRWRAAGAMVAIATDFNPGSCVVDNLPFMMTIGALHCGLTAAEALIAVTWAPALALGLGTRKGALTVGRDADFVVHAKFNSVDEFVADMGRHEPREVWISGRRVV